VLLSKPHPLSHFSRSAGSVRTTASRYSRVATARFTISYWGITVPSRALATNEPMMNSLPDLPIHTVQDPLREFPKSAVRFPFCRQGILGSRDRPFGWPRTRGRLAIAVTALPVFPAAHLRFGPEPRIRGDRGWPRSPLTCTYGTRVAPCTHALLFTNFLSRVASGIMAAFHVFTTRPFIPRHDLTHDGSFRVEPLSSLRFQEATP